MPKCMTRRLLSQQASAGSKPGSSGVRELAAANDVTIRNLTIKEYYTGIRLN